MVFDIIIALILVSSMAFGFRKGFVYTITHTLGWFVAMAAALVASGPVRGLVQANTDLDERVREMFLEKLNLSSDAINTAVGSLPPLLKNGLDPSSPEIVHALAEKLTFLTMTILCFAVLFLVIKAILFLITLALLKKDGGFSGVLDGILGMVAGLIKGIIFVFVFLALLVPFTNLFSTASTQLLADSLKGSYVAGSLYESNFIMVIIENYLS